MVGNDAPRRSNRERKQIMTVYDEAEAEAEATLAVATEDKMVGNDAPRRSNRERKQIMTVYDEAEATLAVAAVGSSGGGKKSAKASTGKRKNNNSSSTGKRKGNYQDNFVNTKPRKIQKLNKDNKLEVGQILFGLAEDPGLDTMVVHLCKDKKGKKRPVIVMSHALDILNKMKKINSSLNFEKYAWNYWAGREGSDEAKLYAMLRGLGFWTVKTTSLTKFQVKPPSGGEWKNAVCHPLLDAADYVGGSVRQDGAIVGGTFNEDKVAQINGSWRRNNKMQPNPFEDSKKSEGGKKRVTMTWRGKTIALQSVSTDEEAEELKKDAKDVFKRFEDNSEVTKEEIEEVLKDEGIKSKLQRNGWEAGTKRKTAPKKSNKKKKEEKAKKSPTKK